MQSGSDLFVLCFVDFLSPAHAATALDALQGELVEVFLLFVSTLYIYVISFDLSDPLHACFIFVKTTVEVQIRSLISRNEGFGLLFSSTVALTCVEYMIQSLLFK